jgi:hypothetical protein
MDGSEQKPGPFPINRLAIAAVGQSQFNRRRLVGQQQHVDRVLEGAWIDTPDHFFRQGYTLSFQLGIEPEAVANNNPRISRR